MNRNTLIFIICLVIVAGGLAYYFFFFDSGTDATLVTQPVAATNAELSFITLVGKLDPIVFDTTLLSDPRFMTRENIRTVIIPEEAGRTDPFAPLGR